MTIKLYNVAYLNVAAEAVLEIMKGVAPDNFLLRCAEGTSDEALEAAAAEADFILAGPLPVTRKLLENSPRVRLIQKFGIGVDKIDLSAAKELNIPVAITAGSNSMAVAEMAVLLMLAAHRRLPMVDRRVRAGDWPKAEMRGLNYRLNGKTLGIYGFGHIGRYVAKLLSGFDMEILYHDLVRADPLSERLLNARYVSFDELVTRSDVISLHAPLNASTHGIFTSEVFSRVKSGLVLVNTARGELVDEQALYHALISGKVRGAGLDTFVNEPPKPDNPLLSMDQVVVTSHIGGAVLDNVENVARHAFENMSKVLAGIPISPPDLVS